MYYLAPEESTQAFLTQFKFIKDISEVPKEVQLFVNKRLIWVQVKGEEDIEVGSDGITYTPVEKCSSDCVCHWREKDYYGPPKVAVSEVGLPFGTHTFRYKKLGQIFSKTITLGQGSGYWDKICPSQGKDTFNNRLSKKDCYCYILDAKDFSASVAISPIKGEGMEKGCELGIPESCTKANWAPSKWDESVVEYSEDGRYIYFSQSFSWDSGNLENLRGKDVFYQYEVRRDEEYWDFIQPDCSFNYYETNIPGEIKVDVSEEEDIYTSLSCILGGGWFNTGFRNILIPLEKNDEEFELKSETPLILGGYYVHIEFSRDPEDQNKPLNYQTESEYCGRLIGCFQSVQDILDGILNFGRNLMEGKSDLEKIKEKSAFDWCIMCRGETAA